MNLHFTTDWVTHSASSWKKHLDHLKGRPHTHFLEIGSFEGRSACWFLQHILMHSTSTLTCIDIFPVIDKETIELCADCWRISRPYPYEIRTEDQFDHNIRVIGACEKVKKLKGESRVLLRTLPVDSFDCIYIDGSHLSVDVLKDALLTWDLLKKNGILIFDDFQLRMYENPQYDPKIGINAFLGVYSDYIEILHIGWQIIARKKSHKQQHYLDTIKESTHARIQR